MSYSDDRGRNEKAPGDSWAMKAAIALALIGVAAFLYVVFAGLSKPDESPLAGYRTGSMTKLIVARQPPLQPTRGLLGPDGNEAKLSDFRGKVVLVNVWATWCSPCVEEMPTLARLQTARGGDAFQVVAVSIDRPQLREKAAAMLAKLSGGALSFYEDTSGGQIAFDLQAPGAPMGVPTSVFYDRQGREIARMAGGTNWSSPEALKLVDELIRRP